MEKVTIKTTESFSFSGTDKTLHKSQSNVEKFNVLFIS